MLKKSDMHVHPRVPTMSRCLVGQIVEETSIDTSDESDVEAQIRSKVRRAQREQDRKLDAQWIEWYNMGSEPMAVLDGEQVENEDRSAEGEREESCEISEKKRSKKSKKRRQVEERDLPLVKFTILQDAENPKTRLLTLETAASGSFHCFTRSKKSVRGRWRYQPTFYYENLNKCIYSDIKKPGYKKWLVTTNGWRAVDSIWLPFKEGQYFSVSETEKAIIEEGREQM